MKAVPANLLQVLRAEAKPGGESKFASQVGSEEGRVIRAEHDFDSGREERGQRMILEPGADAGAEIGADTDLERHIAPDEFG
jgi:hypothetical protein